MTAEDDKARFTVTIKHHPDCGRFDIYGDGRWSAQLVDHEKPSYFGTGFNITSGWRRILLWKVRHRVWEIRRYEAKVARRGEEVFDL